MSVSVCATLLTAADEIYGMRIGLDWKRIDIFYPRGRCRCRLNQALRVEETGALQSSDGVYETMPSTTWRVDGERGPEILDVKLKRASPDQTRSRSRSRSTGRYCLARVWDEETISRQRYTHTP
ncbi:hypothetical protein K438DRAFT_1782977 [Mycena galopus ATCC 62051]|nr:hypothetical protein K438DRAFT_1782977 [Mycena galopus ATCC 62051]